MRSSAHSTAPWIVFALALFTGCAHWTPPPAPGPIPLEQNWRIQSSAAAPAEGREISSTGFDASSWIPASVPSTVFAAQLRNGDVPDPFEGRNLETLPSEPYEVPWWYRSEFSLEGRPADGRLIFEGINYRAEVWLNGRKVAGPDSVYGAFRVFDLDVTRHLRAGRNVLAVKVFPPQPGDPTIGFVDWNPESPDNYLGIWRPVTLKTTGAASLDAVWVRGDVDPRNLEKGQVSIGGKLVNHTSRRLMVTVRGRIGPDRKITFERSVSLKPREARDLVFAPDEIPQLAIASPRLWWPNNLGDPNLYSLQVETLTGDGISDRFETQFGIRHVEDYINAEGYRGYRINGRPLLLRGGGWADDVLLREDPQRLEDQIRYVRHMNLNTVRLEGFWGNTQRLFDLTDRYGIMVWAGWSCQWEWEDYLGQPVDEKFGGIDTAEEIDLITHSLRDQVVRLRNHPSVILWVLGSDMLPRPELERRYLDDLARIDPTRPSLSACSVRTSEVTGPSGVKMEGPYEWVPPNYWFDEKAPGGAFGLNTETGPGAQPPVAESLRRMLPKESWWPIDEMWAYHSARHEFKNLDRYVAAMNARYGPAKDLDDFALRAQMVNYEAMRAMFESFSLRRPVATGIIQWMMNSAWPEMYWQFYDYYLVPTGAFYAARDASRPVHIAYDHGTGKLVGINDTNQPLDATARVRVYDASSQPLLDQRVPLVLAPGERRAAFELPAELSGAFRFVDARIEANDGTLLDQNFYWLPAKPDVLDWGKGEWFYTPVKEFADLTAVNRLPPVTLAVDHHFTRTADGTAVDVTLDNPTPNIAFFVELSVAGEKTGALAAPVFWDSNYVTLVPGESRKLHATFPSHALQGEEPVLHVRGMNVGGAAQ
ncbi:MAG: sugar-binding domain-containing protein [Thermoanaerobaculia bacterium]